MGRLLATINTYEGRHIAVTARTNVGLQKAMIFFELFGA
jgi:hypothetical protein